MIWMWLMGCGSTASPIVGCWEQGNDTNCFNADGTYQVRSTKLGDFEGTWSVSGDTLTTQIPPFAADTFTIVLEGDAMTTRHAKRGEKTFKRL